VAGLIRSAPATPVTSTAAHHRFPPLVLPPAWDRADPAALFDVADVRPSRSTLDAAEAADGLVVFDGACV